MPDQTPSSPDTPQNAVPKAAPSEPPAAPPEIPAPPPPAEPGTPFNIGEEFGSAKRNLPPAKIVVIGVAIVLVVGAIVSFVGRAKPQGAGAIDNVSVAEVLDQNMVLVAITLTLRNTGARPLWIHSIQGKLTTDAGELTDVPISAVDFDRYFQAFPALKEHAGPALVAETKLAPGEETHGTVIVSFPVTQNGFNKRKALSVAIQPYDQPVPIVLSH
jgi:hypothetical protein